MKPPRRYGTAQNAASHISGGRHQSSGCEERPMIIRTFERPPNGQTRAPDRLAEARGWWRIRRFNRTHQSPSFTQDFGGESGASVKPIPIRANATTPTMRTPVHAKASGRIPSSPVDPPSAGGNETTLPLITIATSGDSASEIVRPDSRSESLQSFGNPEKRRNF